MKKFIAIFVIVFVSSASSQIVKNYGIKIGGTFSIQENVILPGGQFSRNDILGMNIGTFLELFNAPVFSLITEMNYVRKGFKGNLSSVYYLDSLSWNERIDFLNFSILGKTRIESEAVGVYFVFGPRIDFRLNKSGSNSNNRGYDYKDYLLGLKIGLGGEISISQLKLLTEFIYDYGFENISEVGNIKFNTFDFRIGVCF